MVQPTPSRVLALACAVALATLLLLRLEPGLAAAWAAAGTLAAARGGFATAGLAALPTLLAALPGPPPLAPLPAPGPVRIAGTVADVVREAPADSVLLVLATPAGRVRLHCQPVLAALPGDRVVATARCSAAAVPGGAPSLHAAAGACRVTAGAPSLPRACTALRLLLEDRLLRLLPTERALLTASLVLGSGTRVPDELAAAHRDTGLSHLLAVSGAHAAMLAMLLGLQPFGGGRRRRVGTFHLAVAMTLLLVYGAITGFEPPVFRALVSYALASCGGRSGRRLGLVAGLGWPALLSCVVAPEGVLGASFGLSYAAVFGLFLAGAPREDAGWFAKYCAGPLRTSFWATAMTAPLTLGWFGQLAPWTVLLTPVLAPLVAAMLFLGLFTAVAAVLLPGVGAACAPPLSLLAGVYARAVELADALPGTPVHALSSPPVFAIGLAALAGLAVALALGTRRGALLGCALAAAPHFLPAPRPAAPSLHVFAVGHGLCCLAQFADGTNVVVDCGSLQHQSLPARQLERALGRRCIDLLVLTHQDRDHTGAVAELSHRLPVRRAVLPAAMRDHPAAQALLRQHCAITWLAPGERDRALPGVAIAAPAPTSKHSNDASLWIAVDLDGTRALVPGDAEAPGIAAALAAGIAAPADVLVLPHHGRRDPAIETLVAAVQPRLCLCSNRSGEGSSAQGRALLPHGVPVFATGDCGDLVLVGGRDPHLTADRGLPLPETLALPAPAAR